MIYFTNCGNPIQTSVITKFRIYGKLYYHLRVDLLLSPIMKTISVLSALLILLGVAAGIQVSAQKPNEQDRQKVRTVTIPISIYTKEELRTDQAEEYIQADRLTVKEDKEEQTILSIRSVMNTPLALEILVQEDLTSDFNLQIKDLQRFIRGLPRGSRVMVGYIRGGSLQIRQRFTDDLERAASSLRIVSGSSLAAANGPYGALSDALNYFDALPAGRRAVLLISDGLDASQGLSGFPSTQSTELERAIFKSQRKSVAVYSIYYPATLTVRDNSRFSLIAQGSLERLSDETGGRAFFQGSLAPVSLVPFFKDLGILLGRQFALTYLSTHMKKGYHRVEVSSTNPVVKIEHPKGYYYR